LGTKVKASKRGPSYYKSGIYAGTIGGKILQSSAPGGIPIIDPQVVETAFNLERTKMLEIEIPIKELVQADEISLYLRKTRSIRVPAACF